MQRFLYSFHNTVLDEIYKNKGQFHNLKCEPNSFAFGKETLSEGSYILAPKKKLQTRSRMPFNMWIFIQSGQRLNYKNNNGPKDMFPLVHNAKPSVHTPA